MIILRIGAFCVLYLFVFTPIASAFSGLETYEQDHAETKVLVFLSQGCPCSRSHVAHLNDLVARFPKVSFFGVITDSITDGNKSRIENYYSGKKFKFPLIADPKQVLVKSFDALKTPHVTLLRKNKSNGSYERLYQGGVTDRRDFGRATKKFLEDNLLAISSGASVVHQQGKSLGCYIRRL